MQSVDIIARALHGIEREKNELAHAALRTPAQRDSFEYGRVAGIFAGLERAAEILRRTIKDSTEALEHGANGR